MAFLHDRFPATQSHEVWGSQERVFKQVCPGSRVCVCVIQAPDLRALMYALATS